MSRALGRISVVFAVVWILGVAAFLSRVRPLADVWEITAGIAFVWIGVVALRRRVAIAEEQTRLLQWWEETRVVRWLPWLVLPRPFGTAREVQSWFPAAFGLLALILGVTFTLSTLLAGGGSGRHSSLLFPRGTLTKAQARTYARGVNLSVADFPQPANVSGNERGGEQSGGGLLLPDECRTYPAVEAVAFPSPTFSSKGLLIKSVVEIMPTAALASEQLGNVKEDLERPSKGRCMAGYLAQAFGAQAMPNVGRVSLGSPVYSVARPSVPRSFGFRFAVPFTLASGLRSFHASLRGLAFGFVSGRAGIGLIELGLTDATPSGQRLLSLLYSRAKAHSL
jgi:hypothetical protein